MRIAADELDDQAAHRLLKGCVVPRPVAWISTLGLNGVANAAPYSCFAFVATRPPMVAVSIEPRGTGKKDTLRNIEDTGEFVVNVVPETLAEAMNRSAEDFPPEISEIDVVGATALAGERVRAPRIGESPVQLECRATRILDVGLSGHRLVLGEVLLFHVRDDLYRNGEIDVAALRPIGRLGGNGYVRMGEAFELDRPWLRRNP